MAQINAETGMNTTQFGIIVASVAHLPPRAQEHLIVFPTTFINQSPDLDAISRAVAIVSSIALPPGMFPTLNTGYKTLAPGMIATLKL